MGTGAEKRQMQGLQIILLSAFVTSAAAMDSVTDLPEEGICNDIIPAMLSHESKSSSRESRESLCTCDSNDSGLVNVDCSNGDLTYIPAGIPDTTQMLDFRKNKLTSINREPLRYLWQLDRLYLQENNIDTIEPGAFSRMYSLINLDLSKNKLMVISHDTFANLPKLTTLRLGNNKIQTVDARAFMLTPALQEIALQTNELYCDCSTKYMMELLPITTYITSARCANLGNKLLTTVEAEEFGDCQGLQPLRCSVCEGAQSTKECPSHDYETTCLSSDKLCAMSIEIYAGRPTINMGCQSRSICKENLSNERQFCNGGEDQVCHFCCANHSCNTHVDLTGYPFDSSMILTFTLARPYDEDLNNGSSDAFDILSDELSYKIDTIYMDRNYSVATSVNTFNPGSIICDLSLIVTPDLGVDLIEFAIELYDVFIWTLQSSELDLEIDPDTVQLKAENSIDFCPSQTIENEFGIFDWPNTEGKDVAILDCPLPKNGAEDKTTLRRCALHPSGSAMWEEPDMRNCARIRQVTDDLQDLVNQPVTDETILDIAESFANLTGDAASSFSEEELEFAVQMLNKLTSPDNASNTEESVGVIVTSFNNLLNVNLSVLSAGEIHSQAATRTLQSIDLVSSQLTLVSDSLTFVEESMALSVIPAGRSLTGGAAISVGAGSEGSNLREKNVVLQVNSSALDSFDVETGLSIPNEVFETLPSNTNLQFVIFDDDKLFQAIDLAANDSMGVGDTVMSDDESEAPTNISRRLNSKIVSATFQGQTLTDLIAPITIILRHSEQNATDPLCVFWSFDPVNGPAGGGWDPSGCTVAEHYPGNYTVCHCDHLTNFALIMDIYGTGRNISYANRVALSVISYVGCGISLAALALTVISYGVFRKQSRNTPAKILINLCVALFFMLLCFILATQSFSTSNEVACKVVAALLHYFMLASWFWMFIEAVYMYMALVRVFNTYYSKFIFKCCAFGWGLPAVVVAIVVSISRDNYGAQGEICWLDRIPFFASCLAPIILILILNFITCGLVIHQLCKYSPASATIDKSQRTSTVTQLRGALSVTVLLGLTWVFAIFAVGSASLVFHYLFAIFNSLQGLFIFIFYCLMKKDMQRAWKNSLYSKSTSTTGSSGKVSTGRSGTNVQSSSGRKPSKSRVNQYQDAVLSSDDNTDVEIEPQHTNGVTFVDNQAFNMEHSESRNDSKL